MSLADVLREPPERTLERVRRRLREAVEDGRRIAAEAGCEEARVVAAPRRRALTLGRLLDERFHALFAGGRPLEARFAALLA